MLTSVELKRKDILDFTGVNLAVNLALSAQHWSIVEKMQLLDPPASGQKIHAKTSNAIQFPSFSRRISNLDSTQAE